MADADGPGAIAWAQALTDPGDRQRSLAAVARSTGYSDIATAQAAAMLLPPGAMRNETLRSVAGMLGWTDPEAGKEWIMTLKPNEQALVMRDIVGQLAGVDEEAAEKNGRRTPAFPR